ncbi:MAG: mandelate racemase/muconate lactonizing enzyme family protein, partial [Haliea sp.]
AWSVLVAPHSGSLGPVAEVASVHLMGAIPNALILERMEPDWEGRSSVLQDRLEASEGLISVPQGPGLGVRLDTEFVAAHPSRQNVGIASGGWNAGTADETVYTQARRPRAPITKPKK